MAQRREKPRPTRRAVSALFFHLLRVREHSRGAAVSAMFVRRKEKGLTGALRFPSVGKWHHVDTCSKHDSCCRSEQ